MSRPYAIKYITGFFFSAYSTTQCPEILNNSDRPYMVLLVQINGNNFAIPFRTNIRHNACYIFRNSNRNTNSHTGLDFSKAIIVNDPLYIGDEASIDDREYLELSEKHYHIIEQFKKYVDGYYQYVQGILPPRKAIKYQYTTLQYFKTELGINDD